MLPESEWSKFLASRLLAHEAGWIERERVGECRFLLMRFPEVYAQESTRGDQETLDHDVAGDASDEEFDLLHAQCLENDRFCILATRCSTLVPRQTSGLNYK